MARKEKIVTIPAESGNRDAAFTVGIQRDALRNRIVHKPCGQAPIYTHLYLSDG